MKVNRPSATAAHKRLVTAERTDRRRAVYYSSVSAGAPLFYRELSLDRRVVDDLTFTTTTITTPPRSETTRPLPFGLLPSPVRPSSVCFYPTKRIQTRCRTKNPFWNQKKSRMFRKQFIKPTSFARTELSHLSYAIVKRYLSISNDVTAKPNSLRMFTTDAYRVLESSVKTIKLQKTIISRKQMKRAEIHTRATRVDSSFSNNYFFTVNFQKGIIFSKTVSGKPNKPPCLTSKLHIRVKKKNRITVPLDFEAIKPSMTMSNSNWFTFY